MISDGEGLEYSLRLMRCHGPQCIGSFGIITFSLEFISSNKTNI